MSGGTGRNRTLGLVLEMTVKLLELASFLDVHRHPVTNDMRPNLAVQATLHRQRRVGDPSLYRIAL
jgi:hypothetical protein